MDVMKNQKKTAISRLGQCGQLLSQLFMPPVFSLAILVLLTSAALAQLTTADILGTVTDQTGASVPNASVTLINLGTNDQRTVQSNASGDYTFTLLPVGHYSITVKAGGFQASITKDLAVEAGDRARADVHLQLGSESTVVEVTASTPLLPSVVTLKPATCGHFKTGQRDWPGRDCFTLPQCLVARCGLSGSGRPLVHVRRRRRAAFCPASFLPLLFSLAFSWTAGFGSPAARAALEQMSVVQKSIEHGGDGGAIAQQLSPVLDGSVRGQQRAGSFVTAHDDFQ